MPFDALDPAHVTVTVSCNNRCIFCAQRSDSGAPLPLPAGDVTAEQARSIVLAGGEPTLDDGLVGRVCGARDAGCERILVQTNGRRCAYASYVDDLVAAGVTHVDVSLHGPSARVHDYHTQTPGSFAQTAKGLMNLGRRPLVVGVTTVVTRSNFRHLTGIAALLAHLRQAAAGRGEAPSTSGTGPSSWHLAAAEPVGEAEVRWQNIMPRLGMIGGDVVRAAAMAARASISVVATGIPPCVVGPGVVRGRRVDRREPLPPSCASCAIADRCTGPPDGYPEEYAATDLTPFDADPGEGAESGTEDAWFGGIGLTA